MEELEFGHARQASHDTGDFPERDLPAANDCYGGPGGGKVIPPAGY